MNNSITLLTEYVNKTYDSKDINNQLINLLYIAENSVTNSVFEVYRLSRTVKCFKKCKVSCDSTIICAHIYFNFLSNKSKYESCIRIIQKRGTALLPTFIEEINIFLKKHDLDSKSALSIVNKFEELSTEQPLQ